MKTKIVGSWQRLVLGAIAVLLAATPVLAETVRQAQWHLDALNITAVQNITRGNGVTVAVIDTGVEVHPDLAGHVLPGKGFGASASLDPHDDLGGHGTAMAGLIAAQGGGENHALGIAPGVQILPLRVSNTKKEGDIPPEVSDAHVVPEAIRYAVDNGAKVINISLAADGPATDEETSAIAYAQSKDVVVVAGIGNDSVNFSAGHYALVPGVVVVSGTDRNDEIWEHSVVGPEVSIAAPAKDIVTTASRASGNASGYFIGSGTSQSTAIVSGAVALIRSKYPELKAPDVINRLITTARDIGKPGRDNLFGFGELDILKALTASVSHVDKNPLGTAVAPQTSTENNQTTKTNDAGSPGGNPLTLQAIAGFVILGLLFISPFYLIIRRRMRAKKLAQRQQYPPTMPQPPTPPSQPPQPPTPPAPPMQPPQS